MRHAITRQYIPCLLSTVIMRTIDLVRALSCNRFVLSQGTTRQQEAARGNKHLMRMRTGFTFV